MNARAPEPQHRMRVLIAVDRSEPAAWAFDVGAKMAQGMQARVLLVHVIPAPTSLVGEMVVVLEDLEVQQRRAGEELLACFQSWLPPSVECKRMVRRGIPADEILTAARVWAADIILIGTHGRGRLAQLLLGSTAETVVRRARCPVVTVGHPADWADRQRFEEETEEPVAAHSDGG